MEILFWIGVVLLLHTYLLYPLSLPVLRMFFAKPRRLGNPNGFKVSLVIAAHNEEKVIEEKIRNCLELEFPPEQLEILIGSDASTDGTDALVRRFSDRVRLVSMEKRGGKAAVLNRLLPLATGEIVVFCDANTMLLKNALQKLLAPFEDPRIGCVCGRLVLHDAGESFLGMGESMYWNLESELKKMEGALGMVIGANGGIYAIRRNLYTPIPLGKTAMDDFFITTQVLAAGKKAIYEPQAIGSEETSLESFGEFHRKVRISQANFNLLHRYLPLLNPRLGLVAYGFLSHKLLRWLAPLLLLLVLVANIACIFVAEAAGHGRAPLYVGLLGMQVLFYLAAAMGLILNRGKPTWKFLLIPFYFTSMNIALFIGMLKALGQSLGRSGANAGGMWNRVERAEARPAREARSEGRPSVQPVPTSGGPASKKAGAS